MRARSAAVASTLALLTLIWTAPAALAADGGDSGGDGGGSSPTTTAQAPADSGSGDSHGHGQHGSGPDTDKPTPPSTTAPPTTTPPPTTSTPAPQPEQQVKPAPAIVVPKAFLSVTPKTVRPGETVSADARCESGRLVSLVGQGVAFQGTRARVDQNTAEGPHQVTLTCANGPEQVTATDTFSVTHDPNGLPLKASLALSPRTVRPGDRFETGAVCQGGRVDSLRGDGVRINGTGGQVEDNAGDGPLSITLTCTNGVRTDSATDQLRVDRRGAPGDPGDDGQATLWLSPKVVRQGEVVYANGGCGRGQQQGLFGDDVSFRGSRGWVGDNAREGDHRVTRVCLIGPPNGPGPRPQYLKRVEVTDSFRVVRGDGPGGGPGPRDFWLSDRSGYRGDTIDVSVRCRDDRARLDSDVLDDTTLRRDGSRLTGTTHVRGRADEGWHRVTVSCDGNSRSTGFWLLRDRADHDEYLDLDPAYGRPGDSIDVHVGCDSRVGSLDSRVLDDIDLDHDGRPWRYAGTTHVRDDAEPGEHTVRVRCGGDTFEVNFFVQEGRDTGGADDDDGGSPGGGNDVTVYPSGAPETGGGPIGDNQSGPLAFGLLALAGLARIVRNRREGQL
jgi:hypothetical protein